MRFRALACDYDGTIAHHGLVADATTAALERCRDSGRLLILVTGRELVHLRQVFPRLDLFARVVLENGGSLYDPATDVERPLAEAPPADFADRLRALGVPLSLGRVVVATVEPHETAVLETIRALGLEHQVIFNKGAVMVLPSGVNKASGLLAALEELKLSPHNVVGVGDAENDHAFLRSAECGVAVANALPSLRERADMVTAGADGEGVAELIGKLVADDLREADAALRRHDVTIGFAAGESPILFSPQRDSLLVAGTSGGGNTTLATAIIEQLVDARYQCCVIDPEGDYGGALDAVAVGSEDRAPTVAEIRSTLERPEIQCVVNLSGVTPDDRPAFFQSLWPTLLELRSSTGRPHCLLVDEAHHLLPAELEPGAIAVPPSLSGLVYLTTRPTRLAPPALAPVTLVVGVGDDRASTLRGFAEATGRAAPPLAGAPEESGLTALVWRVGEGSAIGRGPRDLAAFRPVSPRSDLKRHVRKYARGALDPEKSL